jgi:hypothetical protein
MNRLKTPRLKTGVAAFALIAALVAPLSAQAHRGWILPSTTVLSGTDGWVGFDAGISNGVFDADHAAMRLDNLKATAPDGSNVPLEHPMQGQWRSTFDVHLTQAGTYKIGSVSRTANATWMLNGVAGRWRGPATELTANIPTGATDVVSAINANRLETFVTLGEPTTTVFTPTGQGIEMVPTTHPSELAAGEAATFQLLKDGAPLANADVTVARGGLKYRDAPEEIAAQTGADGKFTVTWPEAGMYWINTVVRPGGAPAPREGGEGPRPEGARPEGSRPAGGEGRGPGEMGRGGPPTPSAAYTAVVEVLP